MSRVLQTLAGLATMKGIAGVKARKDQWSSLTRVLVGDVEQKSEDTVSAKYLYLCSGDIGWLTGVQRKTD